MWLPLGCRLQSTDRVLEHEKREVTRGDENGGFYAPEPVPLANPKQDTEYTDRNQRIQNSPRISHTVIPKARLQLAHQKTEGDIPEYDQGTTLCKHNDQWKKSMMPTG